MKQEVDVLLEFPYFLYDPTNIDNLISGSSAYCFLVALVVKNPPVNARDHAGLTPGSERSPEVGNGKLLQYSCLEKFHGQRTLVGCLPWGCKELEMTEALCLSSRSLRSNGISSSIYCLKHQLNKLHFFSKYDLRIFAM